MWHKQMGAAVIYTAPTEPNSGVAVTVLGLITILLGGAYAALGGQLILGGVAWAGRTEGDPWGQMATLFGLGPALVIAIGIAFLPLCVLGLLGGMAVLLRKQWGRIVTFFVAALAILLGLVWVGGGDKDTTDIAVGTVQLIYGIAAFVILIGKGAEFRKSCQGR
jgi:hypothetical protein